MNREPLEQYPPSPASSRPIPALVIDLNSLTVGGEPWSAVLETAQEAVRQAMQHLARQGWNETKTGVSEFVDGQASPDAPEKVTMCAVGWARAKGDGRFELATQQALAHPLLREMMQRPRDITRLGIALSTPGEPVPLAEIRCATQCVIDHFDQVIDVRVDFDPHAMDVPIAHVEARIWVVRPVGVGGGQAFTVG